MADGIPVTMEDVCAPPELLTFDVGAEPTLEVGPLLEPDVPDAVLLPEAVVVPDGVLALPDDEVVPDAPGAA